LIGAPVFGGAKPVPFNPDSVRGGDWGAALVAVSGPLTNFFLAFVTFGIWAIIGAPMSGLAAQILITSYSVNLGFFIFNMIPFPPLDGSRVLYALAPEFVRSGMRMIEQFGVFFVFALILVASGPIGQFMLGAINFFVEVFANVFRV